MKRIHNFGETPSANKNRERDNMNSADIHDMNMKPSGSSLEDPSTRTDVESWKHMNESKNQDWATLGIKTEIANLLVKKGFTSPSPVQSASIPHALLGKDLLVKAWNGTGKTGSFIIPILNKISKEKALQALVIVPTRELALQISKLSIALGTELGLRCMPAIGGTNLADDILRLSAGVHLMVGTPGRIDDLLSKKLCAIENGLTLVFDEADKMLDATFYVAVSNILSKLPKERQTLLYSATFPRSIIGFVSENMNSPLRIKVDSLGLKNISQFFAKITLSTKILCLKSLLTCLDFNQCIIYCNSSETVKLLGKTIIMMGMSAYFIYSTMDINERNIVYHNFTANKCKILVSTDVTTRGIDVPGVNVVINFDLADSSESYQHRIGRAGRFGRKACAINLIHDDEKELLARYAASFGSSVLPISDPSFLEFSKNN